MRLDAGPEQISLALAGWAEEHGVQLEVIEPDKLARNPGFLAAHNTK